MTTAPMGSLSRATAVGPPTWGFEGTGGFGAGEITWMRTGRGSRRSTKHPGVSKGCSRHPEKNEADDQGGGTWRRRDAQLPDSHIQIERQGVGLFRRVQKPHWILPDPHGRRGLQEGTIAVQTGQRFRPFSTRSADSI